MTEQAYLEDSSVREFEATVERVVGDRVVLDRTHFYPEGGGQPADHGVLETGGETWDVVDVEKRDTVYHHLDGDADPPAAGTTVTGRLDRDRRERHMRYHTAQHLLSALLLAEYGAETTGNQLYTDHAHLDCAYDRFHDDELEHVEGRLNELVADARPVRWYVLDRAEAEDRLDPERTRLALLPDSITEIRIVEIGEPTAGDGGVGGEEADADTEFDADTDAGGYADGPGTGDAYDRTACAGTHVTNTADVGTVEVTGRETKGSEEERLHFVLAE